MTDSSMIGSAPRRIDGRRKVTGAALYASDHHLPNMVYGYGVFSTIASGKITSLTLEAARSSPGVLDVFHHGNFPSLYHNSALPMSFAQILKAAKSDESRLPFEDETIYYAGQFVALVVADTFEHARAAAYKVQVSYAKAASVANLNQGLNAGKLQDGSPEHIRGDASAAFASAAHSIDTTYTTPVETHNPMEMHATVASWEDGRLIVYEAT